MRGGEERKGGREGAADEMDGGGAVPEPWAEGVGSGVAPDVAHHRREELLLLLRVSGGGHGSDWIAREQGLEGRRRRDSKFYLAPNGNGHGRRGGRAHLSIVLHGPT
jgi:hypothetical protein